MHQEPRKLLRRNKKAFFIIFKGLSVASNCLRPECLPLILLAISLLIPYISDIFSTILCHVFFLASASAMMSSWCYFFLSHGQVLQFLWPNSTTHCVKSVGEIRSISPYSVWMQKNAEQNNSEYRHFLRTFLTITDYLTQNTMFSTWIRRISIIKYINNTFSIKFKNHKKISLIYL